MFEPPPGYVTVFHAQLHDACQESQLVLAAVGISAEAVRDRGWWFLVVASGDAAKSIAELDAYRQENLAQSTQRLAPPATYDGATFGVLTYAALLILVAILAGNGRFDLPWLAAGRMQVSQVEAGELWRPVTALTLHSDAVHIGGNLVFGSLFGFFAGQALGGGVAWMAIVVAGSLGNYLNALVQTPEHTSIGASTAVFATLGVLVSHSWRTWESSRERVRSRWIPLVGGVLLIAFFGVGGERTDVIAHCTGFLAGIAIGWFACRLPHDWLADLRLQKATGCATVALLALAWLIGLTAATR